MKKSSRQIRHDILVRLYTHLREQYTISLPEFSPLEERISIHQLDAMLAFKSDPRLEELRAALDRLRDGTFGLCLGCKEEIDDDALDIDPARRMCSRCERVYSHVAPRYIPISV